MSEFVDSLLVRLGLHAHREDFVIAYMFGVREAACRCGYQWPTERP